MLIIKTIAQISHASKVMLKVRQQKVFQLIRGKKSQMFKLLQMLLLKLLFTTSTIATATAITTTNLLNAF